MKLIIILLLALFPLCSSASNHYALVFENNTILLVLNLKCSPCDLNCANIQYQIFNKETESVISGGAKPVTTGIENNFRGYMMSNNNTFYTLIESDNENVWDMSVEEKGTQ
ncbi:hypothetical protein FTF92_17395, partial [Salmonella enterica]|nr:hypothetical protein [Salmonella enterica]EJR9936942.1 hypothetical protein [Salmonella enterica]